MTGARSWQLDLRRAKPMDKQAPLIGYCDICGTVTKILSSPNGIGNSDVSSDNRMEVFEVKTIPGAGTRRLCWMHMRQEIRNAQPMNATLRESTWERFQGAFLAIVPNKRYTTTVDVEGASNEPNN